MKIKPTDLLRRNEGKFWGEWKKNLLSGGEDSAKNLKLTLKPSWMKILNS